MRPLTFRQRQRLCDLVASGVTITAAALVVGCSRQRVEVGGPGRRGEALPDRSSRPRRSPRRTPTAVEQAILRAREQLREGPHVIGWALGVAASTVHTVLRRHGRSRLVAGRAAEPIVGYECAAPGELVPRRPQEARPDPEAGPPGDRRPHAGRRRGKAGWQHPRRDRRSLPARLRPGLRRPEQRKARPPSSSSSSASTAATGSPLSACSTDNGSCFKQRWADACASHEIAAKRHGPTARRPTGKPSGSSARCSNAGPTRTPTQQRIRPTRRARSSTRLLQSLPSPPRPRRAHTAPARQQPPWDIQLTTTNTKPKVALSQ